MEKKKASYSCDFVHFTKACLNFLRGRVKQEEAGDMPGVSKLKQRVICMSGMLILARYYRLVSSMSRRTPTSPFPSVNEIEQDVIRA